MRLLMSVGGQSPRKHPGIWIFTVTSGYPKCCGLNYQQVASEWWQLSVVVGLFWVFVHKARGCECISAAGLNKQCIFSHVCRRDQRSLLCMCQEIFSGLSRSLRLKFVVSRWYTVITLVIPDFSFHANHLSKLYLGPILYFCRCLFIKQLHSHQPELHLVFIDK